MILREDFAENAGGEDDSDDYVGENAGGEDNSDDYVYQQDIFDTDGEKI